MNNQEEFKSRLRILATRFKEAFNRNEPQESNSRETLDEHNQAHKRRIARAQKMLTLDKIPHLTEDELSELFIDSDAMNFWTNKEREMAKRLANGGADSIRAGLFDLFKTAEAGLTPEAFKQARNIPGVGTLLISELLSARYPDRYYTFSPNVTLEAFVLLGIDVKENQPRGEKNVSHLYFAVKPLMNAAKEVLTEIGFDAVDYMFADIFIWWIKTNGKELLDEIDKVKVMDTRRKFWRLTANSKHWEIFESHNVIGVGWADIGNANNYAGIREIQDKLRAMGSVDPDANSLARQIVRLRDMKTGDIVFVTDGDDKSLAVAEVADRYIYKADGWTDEDNYHHWRSVKWLSRALGDINLLSQSICNSVKSSDVLYEFKSANVGIEILQILYPELLYIASLPVPKYKTLLTQLSTYLTARHFHFPRAALATYYLSLQTKPFVILTGISGTGKTKLAQLFAEFMSESTAQVEFVSVRPDWMDNRGLLGFPNLLTGTYQATDFLRLLLRARSDTTRPYFIILDEMNLAKVEYYFSDFLSAMESRKVENIAVLPFDLPEPELGDVEFDGFGQEIFDIYALPGHKEKQEMGLPTRGEGHQAGVDERREKVDRLQTALEPIAAQLADMFKPYLRELSGKEFYSRFNVWMYGGPVWSTASREQQIAGELNAGPYVIFTFGYQEFDDRYTKYPKLDLGICKSSVWARFQIEADADNPEIFLKNLGRYKKVVVDFLHEHLADYDWYLGYKGPDIIAKPTLADFERFLAETDLRESHIDIFVRFREDEPIVRQPRFVNDIAKIFRIFYLLYVLATTEIELESQQTITQEPIRLHDEPRCMATRPYERANDTANEPFVCPHYVAGKNGNCARGRLCSYEHQINGDKILFIPPRVEIPLNIYFAGTVNVDETTYMFSPKVLDRANTIEFNEVDLQEYFTRDAPAEENAPPATPALIAAFTHSGEFARLPKQVSEIYTVPELGEYRAQLQELNELLKEHDMHFGYRVADEILLYLWHAYELNDANFGLDTAFDCQIYQKVLPKFHGSQARLQEPLTSLQAFVDEHGYARSARKIARMLAALQKDGFASFA